MIFSELEIHAKKIFNMPDILFTQVPMVIGNYLYLSHDVNLNPGFTKKLFEKLDMTIAIIKDENDNIINDTMLMGDLSTYLVSVIPYNLSNYSIDDLILITRNMIEHWIDSIKLKYPVLKKTSLNTLFKVASLIITFKVISEIYNVSEDKFIFNRDMKVFKDIFKINKNIEERIVKLLKDCYSLSVQELLDKAKVLALLVNS